MKKRNSNRKHATILTIKLLISLVVILFLTTIFFISKNIKANNIISSTSKTREVYSLMIVGKEGLSEQIEYENVILHVEAPAGAFPEGTELRIIPITQEKQMKEIREGLEGNTKVTEDSRMMSFDISFIGLDENGNEVELEPAEGKQVKVSFNYKHNDDFKKIDDDNTKQIKIYHIEGVQDELDMKCEKLEVSEVKIDRYESEDGELVAYASDFSIYTFAEEEIESQEDEENTAEEGQNVTEKEQNVAEEEQNTMEEEIENSEREQNVIEEIQAVIEKGQEIVENEKKGRENIELKTIETLEEKSGPIEEKIEKSEEKVEEPELDQNILDIGLKGLRGIGPSLISFTGDTPDDGILRNKSYFTVQMDITGANPEQFMCTISDTISTFEYDNSIALRYSFDEIPQTVNGNIIVKDLSKYGQDGIVSGATWGNGKYMGAYYFDGVDDYVISESSQVYNLFGTGEHFSVSVWAKPIKYEDWSLLIGEQNGGKYYANSSFGLRSNKSGYTCVIGTHVSNNDSYTYRQTTNYMPSVNQWHNVVCVVDGTTMKMYVDSVQVGNVDISGLNTRTVGSNGIYIGRHTNYKTFPGLIDEVIVYERSLSDSEIENYYNYTKGGYSPLYDSLLLMYNFDNVESLGESATLVKDLSKYGRDGVVYGATWTGNGKHGGSFYFNGTTSNYIQFPNYGALNTNGAISIRAKGALSSTWKILIGNKNGLAIGMKTTQILGRAGSSNQKPVGTVANYNSNGWNHIVVSNDNGTLSYYINGQKLTNSTTTNQFTRNYAGGSIGKRIYNTDGTANSTYDYPFAGYIDEIRVYNRPLSAEDVKILYNSNLAKTDTDKWLYTMKFTGLTDGVYTYEGSVADDEGDIADSVSRSINIDITLPNLALSSDGNGICSRISPVYTVTGIFSELVTDFDESDLVVVNGSIQNFEVLSDTGFVFEVVSDNTGHGAVTVNVPSNRFFDLAGNTNTSNTLSWRYDLVGPTGSIQIDYNGNEISASGSTLNLTLSAEDIGCNGVVEKMQFSCNDTDWTQLENYATTKTFTLGDYTDYGCTTVDGEKTIYVRYVDSFGNTGESFSDTIRYDTGFPEATLSYGDGNSCVGPVVYITGTFSEDVLGVEKNDLQVTNGCISEFRVKSGSTAVWLVKSNSIGCNTYVHEAMDDDINTITICDPTNSTKCVTMMDRNLGAISNDITSTGSHGYHYQWGNNHGFASNYTNNSGSFPGGETAVQTQYDASSYGPSKWYNSGIFRYKDASAFHDWSSKRNGNLWGGSSDTESNNWGYNLNKNVATNAANRKGPCPAGYHVPSAGEWNMLLSYFAQENILKYNVRSGLYYYNLAGLGIEFQETFKIPFAGFRMWNTSKISSIGSYDDLWTSTPVSSSSTNSFAFQLNSSATNAHNSFYRSYGFSVRCFRNMPLNFSVTGDGYTGIIQAILPENTFTDLGGIANESGSNTITWTYDHAAPMGSIDVKYNGDDELATGEIVNLTLSAEDVGCNGVVSGMQFSCNGKYRTIPEAYAITKDFALGSYTSYGCNTLNGEKTIYVRYIDGLGNISEVYSDSIMLNVSPKVEISSVASGICISGSVYVTGTFNKSVTGIDNSDIVVSGGCIQHFRKISNTKVEYVVTNDCNVHLQNVNGVNTISVCDPNDSTKCITMMDTNLGATTNNTSSTGSYGYHYQWGNNHGFASNYTNGSGRFPGGETANTTRVNVSTYGPGNWYNKGTFIKSYTGWSTAANDNLWGGSGDSMDNNRGYDIENNVVINATGRQGPCPTGYHIPSIGEWSKFLEYFEESGDIIFSLNFSLAGYRSYSDQKVYSINHYTYYRGSTPGSDNLATRIRISSGGTVSNSTSYRANAFSIRCFKDVPLSFPSEENREVSLTGSIEVVLPKNRFTDLVGNANESGSNTISWTYDNAGPIGSIDVKYNGNDDLATGETLNLILNAEDPGCNGIVQKMQFSCNGTSRSPVEDYVTEKDFNFWDYTGYGCNALNGEKTIHVKYLDGLGNESLSFSDSIVLNVSPTVELSSNIVGSCSAKTLYRIIGRFNKVVTGVDVNDIIMSGGCATEIHQESGTQTSWLINITSCDSYKRIHETMDGDINTLTICSPDKKGKCITMMDRNLGATTNNINNTGSYGYHYERGNNHGFKSCHKNNCNTFPGGETRSTTLVNTNGYGPGNRYSGSVFRYRSNTTLVDWSSPSNNNLRGGSGDSEDNNFGYDIENNVSLNVTGRQGPCPDGYHVPSIGEWEALVNYWAAYYTGEGNSCTVSGTAPNQILYGGSTVFRSDFKIPLAGYRAVYNLSIVDYGKSILIRSSTPGSKIGWTYDVSIGTNKLEVYDMSERAYGWSIRCFKDYPFIFDVLAETGTIEISLPADVFTDLAGNSNESGSNTIIWDYDFAGPTGSIDVKYYGNDEVATGETVSLILSAEDQGCNGIISGMQFSCNGASRSPLEEYVTSKDFNFWDYTGYGCSALNGEKTIYVRYIDGLGNIGETFSDNIMLHISPKLELTSSISSGVCMGGNVSITGIFDRAVTGLKYTELVVTGGCIKEFHQIGNTGAEWVISNNCNTQGRIIDGLKTISVCNPNNSTKCITMMDRNLGATSNDITNENSYGKFYQRGNNYGFNQNIYYSITSRVLATWSDEYNNKGCEFNRPIISDYNHNYDYWSDNTPANHDGLRGGSGDSTGNNRGYYDENNVVMNMSGRQGPCPEGYHVPSAGEWNKLLEYRVSSYTGAGNDLLNYDSDLSYYSGNSSLVAQFVADFNMPLAGNIGTIGNIHYDKGIGTYLRSSSPYGYLVKYLKINLSGGAISTQVHTYRTVAMPLRCFKNYSESFPPFKFGTVEVSLPENNFTDLAGNPNESPSNTVSFNLDNAGPTGSIDVKYNGDDINASGTMLDIVLSAEDQGCNGIVSGMQFSCNGKSWTPVEDYATTKNFDLLDYTSYGCNTVDGSKTIYVRYIDAFGNVGDTTSDSIILNIPPEVSLSVEGDNYCKGRFVAINGTFSESVTGLDTTNLIISGGCTRKFDQKYNNKGEWIIKAEAEICDDYIYEATDESVNTLTVCNPYDETMCLTMMDRNLGATTNDINSTGSYGYHYQRGNNHGFESCYENGCNTFPGGETSSTTRVNTNGYGPGNWYNRGVYIYSNSDWSSSINDRLRGGYIDNYNNRGFDTVANIAVNVTGRQGPCPDGYHIPSVGEWSKLVEYYALNNMISLSTSNNLKYIDYDSVSTDIFKKSFNIPMAGIRANSDGKISWLNGNTACLWTSSPNYNSVYAYYLNVSNNRVKHSYDLRGRGASLRCFKDIPLQFSTIEKTNSTGIIEVTLPTNSFTDLAGNENISGSNILTWEYDAMGPTGTIYIEGDYGLTSSMTLNLVLSAEDLGCNGIVSGMQFSCNGTGRSSAENYATSKSFSLSSNKNIGCDTEAGEKTIYVRYIDSFGNIGNPTSGNIILDTIHPQVEFFANTGDLCRNTLTGQYVITGIFNEVVTGVDDETIYITNGFVKNFEVVSGTLAQWTVEISDDYPIAEKMDGNINTFTICEQFPEEEDPNCITIMDRNLGATQPWNGFGYTDVEDLCYDNWSNHGFSNYDSCLDMCVQDRGNSNSYCEDYCKSNYQGYDTLQQCNQNMGKLLNNRNPTSSFGNYYQWGNNHGFPNTGLVITGTQQIDCSEYGPYNPLSNNTFLIYYDSNRNSSRNSYDYCQDSNDNLWGGGNDGHNSWQRNSYPVENPTERQGPCPTGYHVPSVGEWDKLRTMREDIYGYMGNEGYQESATLFQNSFKFPLAGYRSFYYNSNEYYAYLWSSSPYEYDNTSAYYFRIGGGEAYIISSYRSYAYNVRCFRDIAFDIDDIEDDYTYTGSTKRLRVGLPYYYSSYSNVTDLAGNRLYSDSELYFEYDIEGPIGLIDIKYNGNDTYAKGTTLQLSLPALDQGCSEVDKVQFSCNGTNWSPAEDYSKTKSFELGNYTNYGCTTGDGEKTIYARYFDKLGNTSDIYSDTIILDTILPEVELSSDGSGMCSRLSSAIYTVTGVFSEPVLGLSRFDLLVIGGSALNFDKFSNTGAVWTVKPGSTNVSYIYEMADNEKTTLTICDPNDNTKCITMMDRNLGATESGTGCNRDDYQCSQGYIDRGYNDYDSCYQDCTDYGVPTTICENDCTPDLKGYETIDECRNNIEDDFYECVDINSGLYGYHYQWGNNYGFDPCIDNCSDFPGGEHSENTQIDTSDYGPGNWYSGGAFIFSFSDWSNPSNDNLRGGEGDGTGNNRGFDIENNVAINVTGRQGPCDTGYHVPSIGEWNKLLEYRVGHNSNLFVDERVISYNEEGLLYIFNCMEGSEYSCWDENWENEVDCDSEDAYHFQCRDYDNTIGLKFQDDFKIPFVNTRESRNYSTNSMGYDTIFWSSSPGSNQSNNVSDEQAYSVYLEKGEISDNWGNERARGMSLRCFRDTAMALPQELTGLYGSVTMSIPQNMFTDLAGNENITGSNLISFGRDEAGPTGGINIHYNGNTTHASGTTLNLSLDAEDVGCSEVDKVKFSCDGETWSSFEDYNATTNFSLANYLDVGCTTGDGEKTIYVQYFDTLGNTGDISSGTIIVDTVAPQIISLTSDGSGTCDTSKVYTVTGIFSEALSGLKSSDLMVTNGTIQEFEQISSTVAIWKVKSNPGHGEISVSISSNQIYDLAGNGNLSGSDVITRNFDETGPTGSIDVKYNGDDVYATGTTLSLTLSASDLGCSSIVDKMQFSCNGTDWSSVENYNTTKSFELGDYKNYGCTTGDGQKKIYVRYIDGFGNTGESYNDTIIMNRFGITLQATATAANQKLKINKYFTNAYTVDRGDGTTGNLTSSMTHTYANSGTYIIRLLLGGSATRWKFGENNFALVPQEGTTVTGVKIINMPSLAEGFGNSATNPGNYFFFAFNQLGAITSFPEGSFDTSNITTAGDYFFAYFNNNGKLSTLPIGSFDIGNISSVGHSFFRTFNQAGSLTSLPEGSFNIGNIDTAKGYFFYYFNYSGDIERLPDRSFNTSNIKVADVSFFYYFNGKGAITSLPEGSFDTSNITSVGDNFFGGFNFLGSLTSLSTGSFNISNISGAVGNNFFAQFNSQGKLESLPEGSFDTSNITKLGNNSFYTFNYLGSLTSLPTGSFDTSNIISVGEGAFAYFNGRGNMTSLPEGSFDTSNIETAGSNFFYAFNYLGAIEYLPDSFKMTSAGATANGGYMASFYSTEYTLNKKVSYLVSGVEIPLDDRNTFSDNQPGRCGAHPNWLVSPEACSITYDPNGGDTEITTQWYISDTTGVDVGSGVTTPARAHSQFVGRYTGIQTGSQITRVLFPAMDAEKLYAYWSCDTGYTLVDNECIDITPPTVTISSDGSGMCGLSTTYTVTGIFSESVIGISTGTLTVTNGTIESFEQISGDVVKWIVGDNTNGTGLLAVNIATGAFTDLAGNENITGSNMISWNYDNEGPEFVLDDVEVPECTTGTMTISGVTQVGCASGHNTSYSWDAGNTWATTVTDTAYSGGIGTKTITVQVRDILGNYTEKTAVYRWTDTSPAVNNFSVDAVGTGKTVNWKILGNARDGACGSGNVTAILQTDASIGHCTIDGNDISFVANEGVSGSDTCTILVTDDENSTGEFTITWNNIFRPIPEITFTGTNPANGIEINQNRFTTKMNISNIDNIKDFKYQYNNSEYDLMSGLVLMYNFDNIESLGESSTLVKDLSNNGNDGIVNGATRTSNGKYRGAYSFDGTNDYVSALQTGELSQIFGPTGTVFTLSAWAKPTLYKNWSVLLGNTNGGYYSDTTAAIWVSSQGFQCVFGAGVPNNPGGAVTYKTYGPELNQRHHIVCVADGTKMNMYVDGIIRGTYNLSLVTYPRTGNTNPVYVGKRSGSGVFSGEIDEVRIYNRALSQDEVQFLYKSNLSKINPDTWEFETVNTCLTASGIYNYTGIVKSFVDTSASTGRSLTTNIPQVTVNGVGYDFGAHKVNETGYILSGTMGELTVTDKLGNSGWLVYFASSESLVGTATQKTISTENLKFKANSLIYSGMYEGYTNTYVTLGSGISMTEFKTAYSSGCTAGQEECTGNSVKILDYIKRNDNPQDFMCGEVGTYSDNPQIQLEVPARQIGDEYKGKLWITLQQN